MISIINKLEDIRKKQKQTKPSAKMNSVRVECPVWLNWLIEHLHYAAVGFFFFFLLSLSLSSSLPHYLTYLLTLALFNMNIQLGNNICKRSPLKYY